MIEKVSKMHPDKVADRIAGAIVDLAYGRDKDPKVAVEVLIGHGACNIIVESSIYISEGEIKHAVERIAGKNIRTNLTLVKQDAHLAKNQEDGVKCGDNGIFKGMPITAEQHRLSQIARDLYEACPHDGKYILNGRNLIVCQSNVSTDELRKALTEKHPDLWIRVNPLGDWTGGTNVDSGATNRKLGSDMADGVTGGGLHGKDLSKADVSVNIYAFLKAQETGKPVELCCAIGDTEIDGKPYSEIVEVARKFINDLGGFEKFAEWGLF